MKITYVLQIMYLMYYVSVSTGEGEQDGIGNTYTKQTNQMETRLISEFSLVRDIDRWTYPFLHELDLSKEQLILSNLK